MLKYSVGDYHPRAQAHIRKAYEKCQNPIPIDSYCLTDEEWIELFEGFITNNKNLDADTIAFTWHVIRIFKAGDQN